jgi:hypothetical protein
MTIFISKIAQVSISELMNANNVRNYMRTSRRRDSFHLKFRRIATSVVMIWMPTYYKELKPVAPQ